MGAVVVLIGLPLFGWWLIRTSRSMDRLADVLNRHKVDPGFLNRGGKVKTWLLFSDLRFVAWLLKRRYRDCDFPAEVHRALEEARESYARMMVASWVIAAIGVGAVLAGRVGPGA